MPGMFIDVQVDAKVAADSTLAKKLVEVCPVNIFQLGASGRAEMMLIAPIVDAVPNSVACGP